MLLYGLGFSTRFLARISTHRQINRDINDLRREREEK